MECQRKKQTSSEDSRSRKRAASQAKPKQPSKKKQKIAKKVKSSKDKGNAKKKPLGKMTAKLTGNTKSKCTRSKAATKPKPKQPARMSAKKGKTTDVSNRSSLQNEAKSLEQIKGNVEKNLLCSICQDIFHDCISLQPCLHSFCSGCYAPWMKKSNKCPTCRLKVTRISKNHTITNIVETFLSQFPERKRTDSDLEALNSRNTIPLDMLNPSKGIRHSRRTSRSEASSDIHSSSDSGESFINVFDLSDFDYENSELSCLSSESSFSDEERFIFNGNFPSNESPSFSSSSSDDDDDSSDD